MRFFTRVDKELSSTDEHRLIYFTCVITLMLFLAVLVTAFVYDNWSSLLSDFKNIIISPAELVSDYYRIGSISAAFLNAALAGLVLNIIMIATKVRPTCLILAGYILVVAHCFYGLNVLNMWPPFLGVMLFCYIENEKLGPSLHLAMFSTALGPFVSELLFRYTLGDSYVAGTYTFSFQGLFLSLVFGIFAGFIIPSLLPGTTKTHRGHNLYKAGLAIGIFGIFAYAFLYTIIGVAKPTAITYGDSINESVNGSYSVFYNIFYIVLFVGTFFFGYIKNGKSLKGYKGLWNCDSLDQNFPRDYGMPLTFINIGIYGLFIILYYNVVIFATYFLKLPGYENAAGFTGATFGVVLAAITFGAAGQTIRNVFPIVIGYTLLYVITLFICFISGRNMNWSLASQGYINGFAFATGLCPFSGRYGKKAGIVAGMLQAMLVTSLSTLHGGYVLYNGGFASGMAALILLPIIDFYQKKKQIWIGHKE